MRKRTYLSSVFQVLFNSFMKPFTDEASTQLTENVTTTLAFGCV